MSKKHKILVIEDDPDLACLYVLSLIKRGYKAVSALDGRSGLRAAETYRPDAVILDRTLPDMDGREACRALQARPIPVLFLSGRRGDPECVFCGACTASALLKPVSMAKLIDALAALIVRHKRRGRSVA